MAGGYGAGDPPDPIPNSEVKTRCADGTAGATRWESTAPPAYLQKRPLRSLVIGAGVSRSLHIVNCALAKDANMRIREELRPQSLKLPRRNSGHCRSSCIRLFASSRE